MRVAFHYLFFGSEMTGGPQVVRSLIALLGDRIEPLVITQRESLLTDALRQDGVSVAVVPLPEGLTGAGRRSRSQLVRQAPALMGAARRYSRAVAEAASSYRPQVWWGRNVWSVLLTGSAARQLGSPFLWDIALGVQRASPLGIRVMRALHWVALLHVRRAVTQADTVQRETFGPVVRLARRKLVTIPAGVAPDRVAALKRAAARRASRTPAAPLHMLCLGSLTARKNQLMLVAALRRLGPEAARFRVVLAGDEHDGQYVARVRDAVRAAGLEGQVSLVGWRADVDTLMAAADVLVVTSQGEGVPLVVREAAFARLPVIATAVGGLPEALDRGRMGRLIPPGDVAALARELTAAADAPAPLAALADAAAAHADERYSPQRWADRYFALMTELAGTSAAG